MTRVAVLGGYAPSLVNFRGPLLAEMARRGHEVIALAPAHDPSPEAALAKMGVTFKPVRIDRRGLNPLRDAATLLSLRRELGRIAPDALLSYTIKPVIYGSLAARLAGVPRIFALVTGLGYAFTEARGAGRKALFSLARGLYSAALSGCSLTMFQNKDDERLFRVLNILGPGAASLVCPGSGVDLDHFAETDPPLDGPPVFLCLSRLLRSKGVAEFAEAARLVKQVRPEAVFRLVGAADAGPDAMGPDEIAAWRSHGVEVSDHVDDVRPLLADCHVYVLPSWREGMPRSVLEAMSAGRAIVTCDVPGCRETVVPGANGWLVPPRDPVALAEACLKTLDDPELLRSMGQASRAMAAERFDVRKVNAQMLGAMGL